MGPIASRRLGILGRLWGPTASGLFAQWNSIPRIHVLPDRDMGDRASPAYWYFADKICWIKARQSLDYIETSDVIDPLGTA